MVPPLFALVIAFLMAAPMQPTAVESAPDWRGSAHAAPSAYS